MKIRLASAEIGLPDSNIEKVEFDGAYFSVTRGDYAPLMQLLADYLEKAKVCQYFIQKVTLHWVYVFISLNYKFLGVCCKSDSRSNARKVY